jgi:hypothetical protein
MLTNRNSTSERHAWAGSRLPYRHPIRTPRLNLTVGDRSMAHRPGVQSHPHRDFFCLAFQSPPALLRPGLSAPAYAEIADSFFVATKRCVLDGTEAPEALRSLAASLTRWRRRGKLRIDSITSGDDRIAGPIGFQRASIQAGQTSERHQAIPATPVRCGSSHWRPETHGDKSESPGRRNGHVLRRPSSYSLRVSPQCILNLRDRRQR